MSDVRPRADGEASPPVTEGIGTLFSSGRYPTVTVTGPNVRGPAELEYMASSTVRPVVTAGASVVAFGLGAATLTDPADATATPDAGLSVELSLPVSSTWIYAFVVLVALALVVGVFLLDDGGFSQSGIDRVASVPFLAGMIVVGTVLVALFLSTGDTAVTEGGLENLGEATEMADESVAETESVDAESGGGPSTLATVALIGAIMLGLLVVVWYEFAGDEEDSSRAEPAPTETHDEREAIGDAAGEAADRIEASADAFENEVYTAWKEMVDAVDLRSPETSTPAEFAAAATDAGMDRRHVETLTDVFEEVRYGGRDVTDAREARAVEALRRIEAEYGGDEE